MVWCFGHEARGISAPQPGMELALPALEGNVLTTGLSGKSLKGGFCKPQCKSQGERNTIEELNGISNSCFSPQPNLGFSVH